MPIYLDYNATTPVLPEVRDAMLPFLSTEFGNPSSAHSFGRKIRKALEEARENVAQLINADPREIVFTSGGTESDNLALQGIFPATHCRGHLITSAIEHHAILETAEYLAEHGLEVTYLDCGRDGRVNPQTAMDAVRADTRLISIMHSNNETGVMQPIQDIARPLSGSPVLLHTDAVQSIGKVEIDVKRLGVDLLSLSGHKFGGPKGIGALYVKTGVLLQPLLHGGSHEHGLRSGTESVASIVGLGEACRLARCFLAGRTRLLRAMRDRFETMVHDRIPGVLVNGHAEHRLPNTSNLRFQQLNAEALLMKLDLEGLAVSAGSACTAGVIRISHVLNAMGLTHEEAAGSLRFSCGFQTTDAEIDEAVSILESCIKHLNRDNK